MPSKKVTIAPKPPERTADDWVSGAKADSPVAQPEGKPASEAPSAPTTGETATLKRLTIDIPEELHARIKSQCALRRIKMADEIRGLLENHFPT